MSWLFTAAPEKCKSCTSFPTLSRNIETSIFEAVMVSDGSFRTKPILLFRYHSCNDYPLIAFALTFQNGLPQNGIVTRTVSVVPRKTRQTKRHTRVNLTITIEYYPVIIIASSNH